MTPKELKKYKENKNAKRDMYCTKCNITYENTLLYRCYLCGEKLIPASDNIPKCPTCQSANIKKISITRKAVHGVAFGILSKTAHSQFECCNCGYKW